jgi:hypothetical protein
MKRVAMLAGGSILVGVVVLTLKSLAYFMTGSVALLSDAIESIVNVATAVDRLELAAVNGDAGLREQAHHAAQRNKPRAYLVVSIDPDGRYDCPT